MALHAVRTKFGGDPPLGHGNSAAALVKGCPVYRVVGDGDITTVATNGTKILGFTAEAASAADVDVKYWEGYAGVQFLLDFSGTYAVTKLGTYVAITVTSGVPTANLDEAGNDSLRFVELVHNDSVNSVYQGWFELATTANQNSVEVA